MLSNAECKLVGVEEVLFRAKCEYMILKIHNDN